MHPFRKLREGGPMIPAQAAVLLNENVVMHTPILIKPILGRELVSIAVSISTQSRLSPVHPSDMHMMRGRFGRQPTLPASPGIECVGVVEALGSDVAGPAPGTRVVLLNVWGSWRELIVSPAERVIPVRSLGRGRRAGFGESGYSLGDDHGRARTQAGRLVGPDRRRFDGGPACAAARSFGTLPHGQYRAPSRAGSGHQSTWW
ncbi:MAG: hypothetical protein E6J65_14005 [Deltaproteobacteria bacterium]|nr:MAG: hypothetical protein E6J65_14005 [Deltaproteobacteria bacterium]